MSSGFAARELSETERVNLVEEYMKITGVDHRHAEMMLEAYNWNYDAAISCYFDSLEEDLNRKTEKSTKIDGKSVSKDSKDIPQSHKKSEDSSRKYGEGTSHIATLASLATDDHEHSSSSNTDEEEGQAFYAGGSVHSGQQVLGPSKKNKGGPGLVKEMFKSAISHGAEVVNSPQSNKDATRVLAFRGIGHVLGSSSDDSVAIEAADVPSQGNNQPLEVCLKAWRNGFSIDDGPLRDYNNPENKNFLDDVRRGEVPQELTRRILSSQGQGSYEGGIHLSLEDRSHENYRPQKQSVKAFAGKGHRLGSPTPIVGATKSCDKLDNENQARKILNVDESQPTTIVQIRLTDGSRLRIKLNYSHTVNDIRYYIVVARPEYSTLVFTLMNSTSYPMQEITDDNLTIIQANLLNSVLVQRMK